MTPAQKDAALKLAAESAARICDAYVAIQNTVYQLNKLEALLPEGATKENVKGLLAVYTPMMKRLDGLQPHGEMDVYRVNAALRSQVNAIRPVVDPAPPPPPVAPKTVKPYGTECSLDGREHCSNPKCDECPPIAPTPVKSSFPLGFID